LFDPRFCFILAGKGDGMTRNPIITRHGLCALLGLLLLQTSGTASAFTLIELPDPNATPGNTVTDISAFESLIRPLLSVLQTHLQNARRAGKKFASLAQQDNLLASNEYTDTASDANFIKVASNSAGPAGMKSLWLGTTATNFENEFSRTEFDGNSNLLVAGFDYTRGDKYIFGISVSIEDTNINTDFNLGRQDIGGYSINPYFAYLISDSWSIDLGLGTGSYDTDQTRATGIVNPAPPPLVTADIVNSSFSTDRDFVATNLTYAVPRGNWYLTGWLGWLKATQDQEAFSESDGTSVGSESLDFERWSLGGEAAYDFRNSETYLSLIYEKQTDDNQIEFATGAQPSDDDDSYLVGIGWRYFGRDLVANIELSSRQGAEDLTETSISTTLRLEL
jgi:hypothetical protein